MTDWTSWVAAVCSFVAAGLLLILLLRPKANPAERLEPMMRQELRASRDESSKEARELRLEVSDRLKAGTDTLIKAVGELGQGQKDQLEAASNRIRELTDSNAQAMQQVRQLLDDRLRALQEANERKLDQMRQTVDEKLQSTLEKRLSESFSLVSRNLEAVQRGLGEMQSLATGVGDLKRALMNVKTRGTWGEVQLGALLDDILTPEQFARNVQTKEGSRESVEYAIRLPGRSGEPGTVVWLPIDAKFPQEDYQRVLDASEAGDADGLKKTTDALSRALQASAKEIHDKHINPPKTTDFAIMFLPTEGLYAEFLRRPGQLEEVQRVHRVVVAGPTTLSAIVTSLRVGFQTLAIEKRSSEVWRVLAAVKSEFGKFETVLAKVKKQLDTAANTIESTGVRTRAMARTLRSVEGLPSSQAEEVLGTETADDVMVELAEETESEQEGS